jgi:hypothetical protein
MTETPLSSEESEISKEEAEQNELARIAAQEQKQEIFAIMLRQQTARQRPSDLERLSILTQN